MRLGLAQLNPTVGDLAGNRRDILAAYHALVAAGAELVVFPELALCGYPPRDLLFKRRFVPDVVASLAETAAAVGDVPAIIGTVEPNPSGQGRPFFNSAAFCHRGRVTAMARKCLLPTYDVFDEDRYFEPAESPTVVVHAGPADRHYPVRGHLDASANQHAPALRWPHPARAVGACSAAI
jgi:NAD+ synthase (glutamine-hydrolysing)